MPSPVHGRREELMMEKTMPKCQTCGSPDKFKDKLKFVHESLSELQKVVHGAGDQQIRDIAYHAVIDIRTFVKEQLIDG
jgi:hypothetical protein